MQSSHIMGSGVHAIHAPSRRISNVRSPTVTHWYTGRNTYTRSYCGTPQTDYRRSISAPLPRNTSTTSRQPGSMASCTRRPQVKQTSPSGTPEASYPPPASSCVAADRDTRRWGLRRARAVASPARD
ncbi:uncharacterized protein PG998_012199 [Apiospora kogelbergensis]|uniref:uncharacterized protein n=1 Tax=Apiospora kogelbergensis TaxID=1337665 RepID=UPI0031327F63